MLGDGTRLQVLTGIDDHSRFCVSATVLVRPTARPVCRAFAAAMRTRGVPEQVLTDNGKVFTGRFGEGTGEVLFDRICRENGIRHLLTAPRSPTTTGKVERFQVQSGCEPRHGGLGVSPWMTKDITTVAAVSPTAAWDHGSRPC